VTPSPKKDALIIPKGTAATAAKPVDRKQVQRINRVANLYQGVMRGGLAKILDSKQLLDSSKLGLGGKLKGDSRTVASALSNLNVAQNTGVG